MIANRHQGKLVITDGTNRIDLLNRVQGFNLVSWTPSYPGVKQEGIFADNPLSDGRVLVLRQEMNAVETLSFTLTGKSFSDVVSEIRKLRSLLRNATRHFTTPVNPILETGQLKYPPVYLIAQGRYEAAPRYAQIIDYRAPQDGDAWRMPFGGNFNPTVDNFTLTIERGPWYAAIPGVGECEPLEVQTGYAVSGGDLADVLIGADDARVYGGSGLPWQGGLNDWTNINTGSTVSYIGMSGGTKFGSVFRFRNVAVTNSAEITTAYITVSVEYETSGFPRMYVKGEKNAAPAQFSNLANLNARTWTDAYVDIPASGVWKGAGYTVTFYALKDIVQEIVNLPAWASGNDMAFIVSGISSEPDKYFTVQNIDGAPAWDPSITVFYDDVIDVDQGESCIHDFVHVCNGDQRDQIESIDTTMDLLVTNTTALPWTLFDRAPNPQVGDSFYVNLRGKIPNIMFNVTVPATNLDLLWEYSPMLAAWTPIPIKDETVGFTRSGMNCIYFEFPDDWDTATVASLRCRIVGGGGAGSVSPVVDVYYPYCNKLNWIDVDEFDADFPALAQISFNPIAGDETDTPNNCFDQVMVGSRSIERGSNFRSFLNIGGSGGGAGGGWAGDNWGDYPTGVDVKANNFASSMENPGAGKICSGMGWTYMKAGGAGVGLGCTIRFDERISNEYFGTYRVFLRRHYMDDSEDIEYMLSFTDGETYYGPNYWATGWRDDTAQPGQALIDFGAVQIPPANAVAGDVSYETFYIQVWQNDPSGDAETAITELILIPTDEWFGNFYQNIGSEITGQVVGEDGQIFFIDGIKPSTYRKDIISYFSGDTGGISVRNISEFNSLDMLREGQPTRLHFLFNSYNDDCVNYQRQPEPTICPQISMKINRRFEGFLSG